ncbi:MAG TPA: hypothetical protein VGI39_26695 [Polyangiaceae bacterium]|jgi:hypothetical protein
MKVKSKVKAGLLLAGSGVGPVASCDPSTQFNIKPCPPPTVITVPTFHH